MATPIREQAKTGQGGDTMAGYDPKTGLPTSVAPGLRAKAECNVRATTSGAGLAAEPPAPTGFGSGTGPSTARPTATAGREGPRATGAAEAEPMYPEATIPKQDEPKPWGGLK